MPNLPSKSEKEKRSSLRLPQVDLILRQSKLECLNDRIDRIYLAQLVREELAAIRQDLLKDNGRKCPDADEIAGLVAMAVDELESLGIRRVINATGVVLNTNLGRAPLPLSVLQAMTEIGSGYSSLEIDLKSGKRGERTRRISRLLNILTGSQMAIVVNNNASSVMLAVAALANGKEVIVSRGELIEIGGSFRVPDVIASAGGTLKEVGTTNKTRLSDYRDALCERTGIILKCHRSNFEISGFTEEVPLSQLVELARQSSTPVVEDLGSGAFVDMSAFGLKKEPTVKESIDAGAGVVLFSGDKLLGGPQAGVIAGTKLLVEQLRKNPMYRALRADKLIIGLIESVLALYLLPNPEKELPVLALAAIPEQELFQRAENFAQRLRDSLSGQFTVDVIKSESTFGGGSSPGQNLPSYAVRLQAAFSGHAGEKHSAQVLSSALRNSCPPVVSLIQSDALLLDFRTVLEQDQEDLFNCLVNVGQQIAFDEVG